MAGKSEQSWRNFQRWGKIWTEKPARLRSALLVSSDQGEDLIFSAMMPKAKNQSLRFGRFRGWRRLLSVVNNQKLYIVLC